MACYRDMCCIISTKLALARCSETGRNRGTRTEPVQALLTGRLEQILFCLRRSQSTRVWMSSVLAAIPIQTFELVGDWESRQAGRPRKTPKTA